MRLVINRGTHNDAQSDAGKRQHVVGLTDDVGGFVEFHWGDWAAGEGRTKTNQDSLCRLSRYSNRQTPT